MVQKFKTLDDAIELARYAHRHQQDRAGMPYFDHPFRVMQTVQGMGARPFVQAAAVLHDVTEDTAFTVSILEELGFSPAVTNLVSLVDRDYSRSLWDSIEKNASNEEWVWPLTTMTAADYYYYNIKSNPDAKMIKLADIADNLQPWRQSYLPETDQKRLQAKYAKAKAALGVQD